MPGRIDLNAASASELSQLVGIEAELADRIIEYRARHGGFRTVDELAQVQGIDDATLKRMRQRLTVGAAV
jgi:competence protein ComEA